jgi:hypothetical protein
MTEAEARDLLRDCGGFGGLETWIAEQPWTVVPGGWTAAGRVRSRSFLLEPFGSDLRITAVTPSGKAAGEWATWTVPGRLDDRG